MLRFQMQAQCVFFFRTGRAGGPDCDNDTKSVFLQRLQFTIFERNVKKKTPVKSILTGVNILTCLTAWAQVPGAA